MSTTGAEKARPQIHIRQYERPPRFLQCHCDDALAMPSAFWFSVPLWPLRREKQRQDRQKRCQLIYSVLWLSAQGHNDSYSQPPTFFPDALAVQRLHRGKEVHHQSVLLARGERRWRLAVKCCRWVSEQATCGHPAETQWNLDAETLTRLDILPVYSHDSKPVPRVLMANARCAEFPSYVATAYEIHRKHESVSSNATRLGWSITALILLK